MKTVYILGAGFSVEAGAPTQASLIGKAFGLYDEDSSNYDAKKFELFKSFLDKQLNVSADSFSNVELEDIFTPLDRCFSENSQYRGIALGNIMEMREAIFYVVGQTILLLLNKKPNSKEYINKFAEYLTKKSAIRAKGKYRDADPVSVISANWDILLDNSIHDAIHKANQDAVVDYCCYISSKDEADSTIKPGLEVLGRGGFNVKLLKLHGSLNWLQCPRCIRLYARFNKKEGIHNLENKTSCRHCDNNFPEEIGNHVLVSNLIMPTFIKDLSNPQYKVIWQNAGIEISEAKKLVFVGYSLPSADFEMRQLLSRMSRKNVEIEVVDFCEDLDSQQVVKNHWQRFFGNRDITYHFGGASRYINELVECS
jgi:NAD-dependent SIR2 family protein deacetylase